MKPDARDGLLFLGLIFLGVGVGLTFGAGPALTVVGSVLVLVALVSAWAAARPHTPLNNRPTVRVSE